MTIPLNDRLREFTGDGSTKVFAADFEVETASEAKAALVSAAGVTTEQTYSTHFTVSIASKIPTYTFVTAPASGVKVKLYGSTPAVQAAAYTENDDFPAASHEGAMDTAIKIAQENRRDLGRFPKYPLGETAGTLVSAAARAGYVARFNATTGDLEPSDLNDSEVQDLTALTDAEKANVATVAGAINDGTLADLLDGQVSADGGDASLTVVDTFPPVSLPRGLRSRFGDVINLKDIKPTAGGGTGDDSQALIDAFEYAADSRIGDYGCKIVIPDGEFLMDALATLDMPGTLLGQRYHGVVIEGQGPFLSKLIANSMNPDGLLDVSMWGSQARIHIKNLQLVSTIPANAAAADNGTMLLVRNRSNTDSSPSDGIFSGRSVIVENIHVGADDEDTGNAMLKWGLWKSAIEIRHCLAPVVRNCTVVTPQKAQQHASIIADDTLFAQSIHFRHCYLPYAYMNDLQGYSKRSLWCHGTLTSFGDSGRWEGGVIERNEVGACRDAIVVSHDYADDGNIYPPLMMLKTNAVNALRNGVTIDKHSSVIIDGLNIIALDESQLEGSETSGILLNDAAMVTIANLHLDGDGYDNGDADCFAGIRTTGETAYVNASSVRLHCDGVLWHNSNAQPYNTNDTPRSLNLSDYHIGGKRVGARSQRLCVDTSNNLSISGHKQNGNNEVQEWESHVPGATADYSPVLNLLRKPSDFDSVANGYGPRAKMSGLSSTGVERVLMDLRTRFSSNVNGSESADIWFSQLIAGALTDMMVFDSGFGGLVSLKRMLVLPSYTVATLPAAIAGGEIFVEDESGGATPAFADGTNWRRVTDRAIVS